jgi:acyl-CoA thioesterase-1
MNKQKRILIIIIGALISCGVVVWYFLTPIRQDQPPTGSSDQKQHTTIPTYTIAAFGDSLTAGYGVALEESYPMQLEKQLRVTYPFIRVINMGVSGETSAGGKDRVSFIIRQKPNLVLLNLGANDMLRGLSPEETETNLRSIIQSLQKENIPILILGMQSVASNGIAYKKQFDAIYPRLAKDYSLPLVPFFLEGVALNQALNTGDGIHPNKEGYSLIISKNINPVLLPYLEKTINARQ